MSQSPKDKNSPRDAYAKAGVNIDAGNQLVEKLKGIVKRTHNPQVLGSLGGFAGCYELPTAGLAQPVLVSATDGVGTKLKLATALGQHQHIGIDLVAMCVNDIIVSGARPLFFLDYYATGQLEVDQAALIIDSIATGCEQAGAALIGGETAEMPGLYEGKDYDLAGFCVGIVDKSQMLDGSTIQAGDILIGLASSGIHANGFSLIRKLLDAHPDAMKQPFADSTLGETLLTPTRIYVKSILDLCQRGAIKAMAHITGGGLLENLPRVLPGHVSATLDTSSWEWPAIFKWIQTTGDISVQDMWKTFNCGVGMILCVDPAQVQTILNHLQAAGEVAWPIGHINELPNSGAPLVMA